jgi:hypothetical protein
MSTSIACEPACRSAARLMCWSTMQASGMHVRCWTCRWTWCRHTWTQTILA